MFAKFAFDAERNIQSRAPQLGRVRVADGLRMIIVITNLAFRASFPRARLIEHVCRAKICRVVRITAGVLVGEPAADFGGRAPVPRLVPKMPPQEDGLLLKAFAMRSGDGRAGRG